MAIADQNGLIAARTNKTQGISFQRAAIGNQTAGGLCSLWRSTAAGKVALYDRLFHIGGLNGTLATAQAVQSQTVLTFPVRGAIADESEWFLEWYADTGATGVTATCAVTYTDTTTANVTVALPATTRAGRLLPIVPGQGKVIASLQTVTLSATTGAAGNFGVTCCDRLAGCSATIITANIPAPAREAVLHEVPNDACLMQIVECSTTTSGDVRGEYTLIQG